MRAMYDSVNPGAIPDYAPVVAGYVDGLYAWPQSGWDRFPNRPHVRITIFRSNLAADVLDVETGNEDEAGALVWVLAKRAAGQPSVVYIQLSRWAYLNAVFANAGQPPPPVWIADYDNQAIIYPGAFAHQYANATFTNANFDISVIPDYWGGVDPPPNVAPPPPVPVDAESANALFWQAGADLLARVAPGLNNDLAASARILAGI
jgi:hypothetical protein